MKVLNQQALALMASFQGEKMMGSDELLQAQAHVCNNVFSFMTSMCLKSAIQLNIPDIINKNSKPMTLDQLLAELKIHPTKTQFVSNLMRILVHAGFFEVAKTSHGVEEGYALTNASRLLLQDHPLSLRPFSLAMLDATMTAPWQHVSAWFQSGDASIFDAAYGVSFWEYASREPGFNNLFNESMASASLLESRVLIDKCKDVFDGVSSVVDVGGGTGIFAGAIAKAFPHIDCAVLDLPNVVAESKSGTNLKYIGGSMFEAVPKADAVLLKNVLHNWTDEECVKILKNCKKATTGNGKAGKVIVVDMVMESEKADSKINETQRFMDMGMVVLVKGKERSEKQWAQLFKDSGFSGFKIAHDFGLKSLIEVYP